jgi:hypothetical protein
MHGPAVDQLVAWVLIHAGYLIEARERINGLPESAQAHVLRIMAAEGPQVIDRIADARTYLSASRKDNPQDIADLHFRLARSPKNRARQGRPCSTMMRRTESWRSANPSAKRAITSSTHGSAGDPGCNWHHQRPVMVHNGYS